MSTDPFLFLHFLATTSLVISFLLLCLINWSIYFFWLASMKSFLFLHWLHWTLSYSCTSSTDQLPIPALWLHQLFPVPVLAPQNSLPIVALTWFLFSCSFSWCSFSFIALSIFLHFLSLHFCFSFFVLYSSFSYSFFHILAYALYLGFHFQSLFAFDHNIFSDVLPIQCQFFLSFHFYFIHVPTKQGRRENPVHVI